MLGMPRITPGVSLHHEFELLVSQAMAQAVEQIDPPAELRDRVLKSAGAGDTYLVGAMRRA